MTRLPAENRDVRGLSGEKFPKYRVGPICSVPGCSRLADHAHHIWRRSFIGGDYAWVHLWDGTILGNLTGLCWRHHKEVTENKAIIAWNGHSFVWSDSSQNCSFLLDPQPPVWEAVTEASQEEVEHIHEIVGPGMVDKCPACKRALPRKREKHDEKRPRKNWQISVPVDERENGADVLDTLLEECAKVFGHDETKATRYYTLAQALALVLQHSGQMIGDD